MKSVCLLLIAMLFAAPAFAADENVCLSAPHVLACDPSTSKGLIFAQAYCKQGCAVSYNNCRVGGTKEYCDTNYSHCIASCR